MCRKLQLGKYSKKAYFYLFSDSWHISTDASQALEFMQALEKRQAEERKRKVAEAEEQQK